MSNIWIITDTHLGHDKMVEYCGRPQDHSQRILDNLKMIQPGSVLIHLGDICIGKDAIWHKLFMDALPGVTKILVKGNHDGNTINWYLAHGWNIVEPDLLFQFNGKRIYFTHVPIPKLHSFDVNIHGHMHNNSHRMDSETKRWYSEDFNKLLAIENTNLEPVLLEEFLKSGNTNGKKD